MMKFTGFTRMPGILSENPVWRTIPWCIWGERCGPFSHGLEAMLSPIFEKYDEYVSEELVRKDFALGILDIEGMKERVLGWSRKEGESGKHEGTDE